MTQIAYNRIRLKKLTRIADIKLLTYAHILAYRAIKTVPVIIPRTTVLRTFPISNGLGLSAIEQPKAGRHRARRKFLIPVAPRPLRSSWLLHTRIQMIEHICIHAKEK